MDKALDEVLLRSVHGLAGRIRTCLSASNLKQNAISVSVDGIRAQVICTSPELAKATSGAAGVPPRAPFEGSQRHLATETVRALAEDLRETLR